MVALARIIQLLLETCPGEAYLVHTVLGGDGDGSTYHPYIIHSCLASYSPLVLPFHSIILSLRIHLYPV